MDWIVIYFFFLASILTEICFFKVFIFLLFIILDNFLDGTLDGTCPGHVRDIKILAGHVPCTTLRVGVALQALITEEKKESFYHVFCLFTSFGQGYQSKDIPYDYHKPSVHT